ncbi:MAG: dual specificity protein phosphatase family protein [Candidatus Azotimanducaceae bacterium]|uniref:Tyrosine specific protein phosphatases domain-containing protein n=1 Tax=OM182 bacterium TaxID=2510334 RepID=A0A520RXJ7_9GAMM|nr:hypothetical protein [Gammaproteobacteria bacterium]OUV68032.1 MAG: hypothetical protein CBC93_03405 [Gammaproteobacteria bacterium TMED133]RZO74972.1 MAG: hypothetical protein EVA68_08045 [OM182 bacterium]
MRTIAKMARKLSPLSFSYPHHRWVAGVIGLLIIIALLNEFVKPRVFPKRFGVVIEESLFRSGRIHHSLLPKVLSENKIDTIVTLTHEVRTKEYQARERTIAREMGVDLVRFPLDGNGTGNIASYIGALKYVYDELGKDRRVLVHCAAGTERTGGFMFFYQTLVLNHNGKDAYDEMRQYQFDPERNPDLLPYLENTLPDVVEALGAHGIKIGTLPKISNLAAVSL